MRRHEQAEEEANDEMATMAEAELAMELQREQNAKRPKAPRKKIQLCVTISIECLLI